MLSAAFADMINTHRVADEVVGASNLGLTAEQVATELKASASTDTPIVTIVARDTLPRRAALLANAAAAAIIRLHQADQDARYSDFTAALKDSSINKQSE
jgi:capsular polysaccharide biosynthesis protein